LSTTLTNLAINATFVQKLYKMERSD